MLQKSPSLRKKDYLKRTEIIYFRDIHKAEVLYNPDVCKVNTISHEKRLVNLCILLGKKISSNLTLPTNSERENVFEKIFFIIIRHTFVYLLFDVFTLLTAMMQTVCIFGRLLCFLIMTIIVSFWVYLIKTNQK